MTPTPSGAPSADASPFLAADAFNQVDLADAAALDRMDVGVIGFDHAGIVQRYNARESRFSALLAAEVLGRPLFSEVAPCMNNFLVAQRFEDALAAGTPLDATIDYVLTWRMRPTPVQMRLLWAAGAPMRYLLLRHSR